MNKALAALTLAVFLAAPSASFAATYQYVNVQGLISGVTAASAEEAIVLALDRAPTSGVFIVPDGMISIPETTMTMVQ